MSEIIGLGVCGAVLALLLLFPVAGALWKRGLVGLCVLAALGMGYKVTGNWQAWRTHTQTVAREAEARQWMKRFHHTDDVITQLRQRLDKSARSAQGWFLLARLYASKGDFKSAVEASLEAHQLAPEREDYFVQYLMHAWEASGHAVLSPVLNQQFETVLRHNPTQPDALLVLAMDTQRQHHDKVARQYWLRLLALLPPESADAKAVRRAIGGLQ